MESRPVDGVLAGLPRRRLWLAGVLPPAPRVAIVGSRAALRRYRDAIPRVVGGAARAGFTVVSGGALGVDGDVHRAALEQGTPQLAVLPLGADRIYPARHEDLFRRIAATANSGVAFTVAAGTRPTRGMFASRNGVVVALCSHLVVIQAGVPSGTLGTGRLALRRGLGVAVVPGSAGAAELVGAGARTLRGDGEGLAAEVAGWLRGEPDAGAPWPPRLAGLERALGEAGSAGLSVDDMPNALEALVLLTEAETLGLVVLRADGRYVAA